MRRLLLTLLALSITAAGAWWWWKSRHAPPTAAVPLHFYFTCDTRGRIEPCGCFSGQTGGLTRVAAALRRAPAGSLKFEIGNAAAGVEDYHVLQFQRLLEAYGAAGYTAVNLGRREAGLSAATLRTLAEKSPVPLVSGNVLDDQSNQPVVRPWLVADCGGVRVGVLGVTDPARLQGEPGTGLKVAPMAESIRAQLPALKAASDVLVCLAFTDEEGMEALAREFYEIPFFLGGDVRQPSPKLLRENQSHLLATTNEGRALAEIHTNFNPVTSALDDVLGDISLMAAEIPQDPTIAAFAAAYRKDVRAADLSMDHPERSQADRIPGARPPAAYAGSATCAACHAGAYKQWLSSGHARAFASLERKDSDADPSCVSCHVTGFGEPTGHQRLSREKTLVNVGCESCHGPAADHAAERRAQPNPAQALIRLRPVGPGQCVQCHQGEFSRPFKWEDFWPHIQHGKEAASRK